MKTAYLNQKPRLNLGIKENWYARYSLKFVVPFQVLFFFDSNICVRKQAVLKTSLKSKITIPNSIISKFL